MKQRCDGGIPCARCQQKNRVCLFTPGRERRHGDEPSDSGRSPSGTSPSGIPDGTIVRSHVDFLSEEAPAGPEFPTPSSSSTVHRNSQNQHNLSTENIVAHSLDEQFIARPDAIETLGLGAPISPSLDSMHLDTELDASLYPFQDIISGLSNDTWNASSLGLLDFPFFWMTNGVPSPEFDLVPDAQQLTAHSMDLSATQSSLNAHFQATIPAVQGGIERQTLQESATHNDSCLDSTNRPSNPPCPALPDTQPGDEDIAIAENFCHVQQISYEIYQKIRTFYEQQRRSEHKGFPSPGMLHAFIQLYFEYFDAQHPFIHPLSMEQGNHSWILALAVAAVGCQYSSVSNADQYAFALQELLQRAISEHVGLRLAHTPRLCTDRTRCLNCHNR